MVQAAENNEIEWKHFVHFYSTAYDRAAQKENVKLWSCRHCLLSNESKEEGEAFKSNGCFCFSTHSLITLQRNSSFFKQERKLKRRRRGRKRIFLFFILQSGIYSIKTCKIVVLFRCLSAVLSLRYCAQKIIRNILIVLTEIWTCGFWVKCSKATSVCHMKYISNDL